MGIKIEKNDPTSGKSEAAKKNKDITPPPSISSFTGFLICVLANGLDLISRSGRVVGEMSTVFEREDLPNLQKKWRRVPTNCHRGMTSCAAIPRSRLAVIVKGKKATIRARLIDLVSSLWCLAQFPDMRRGIILPRSVMKCLSSCGSL
jgi:hypothetical protein